MFPATAVRGTEAAGEPASQRFFVCLRFLRAAGGYAPHDGIDVYARRPWAALDLVFHQYAIWMQLLKDVHRFFLDGFCNLSGFADADFMVCGADNRLLEVL